MKQLRNAALLLMMLGAAGAAAAQPLKKFTAGSKVAFVGNSITEAGFYESYIWLYYMTRFPGERIEIMNLGIGGNTAKDIAARFDDDVLWRQPTTIVLTFGMNDSGYYEYHQSDAEKMADKKVEESRAGFMVMVEKLKSLPGVQKVIMSSVPYDETMKNKDNYFPGKSKTMERIGAIQKEVAAANQWPFVDLYYPMQQINLEGQKKNPEFTIIGKDRIHPGNGGHLVMAYLFLKSQGLQGLAVADVKIDAKSKSVKQSINADIGNLSVKGDGLSFDYTARSLPFPIDSASRMWGSEQKQSDALAVIPFTEEFNQELLQVSNLSQAKYELRFNGVRMGVFGKDEFARGINLALIVNTPQYKQAMRVMDLNQARKDIENKLRDYYGLQFNFFQARGMLFKDDQAAYDLAKKQAKADWTVAGRMGAYEVLRFPEIRQSYTEQMKLVTDMAYQASKPQTHQVEVIAIK
jgi:lysophospholipase L1-like esterase